MSKIMQSIGRIFQGGAKAFSRFPAAMFSAIVVAAVASILIQLDYPRTERIYTNLQIAFAFGAFLGLALAVASLWLSARPLPFILANLASLLISGGLFYYLQYMNDQIPMIIGARIIAGAAISFLVFLLVISRDPGRSDYNQVSFMVLKSALIALIYALVIMLGLYFVAFSVQTLLYNEMSENVYQHIAVWSALGWFAFFLGYFPSFSKARTDDHLETAQKHPAFIEILFAYVLIPIFTALTAVLLIWAVQILVIRKWPEFSQLTAIFSAYTLSGIFLSFMTSHYIQPIARWFRRLFPFTAILFLAFEAYAIFRQVGLNGIRTNEYFISLIWIYALLTACLLLFQKVAQNHLTAFLAIVLITAAVLPVTGFQALPVASQTSRLRQVLARNDMLADNKITSAAPGISLEDKIAITETVNFLLENEDVQKASWFDASISQPTDFKTVFGFDMTFPGETPNQNNEPYTYLFLPAGYLDVSAYQYAINMGQAGIGAPLTIKGQKGDYVISLKGMEYDGKPAILVTRDGETILNQYLTDWLDNLDVKYRNVNGKDAGNVAFDDMILKLEQNGIKLMVVFGSIDIRTDSSQKQQTNLQINSIYLAE